MALLVRYVLMRGARYRKSDLLPLLSMSQPPYSPLAMFSTSVKRGGLVARLLGREARNTNKPRFRLGLFMGGGSVLLFMYSVRTYRDSLVLNSRAGLVHKDR